MPSPPPPPDWSGRLQRVRARLDQDHLEALVVSAAPNLRYLTGFAGSAGLLVVSAAAARLLVDGRYQARARAAIEGGRMADVTVEPVPQRYDLALGATLARAAERRVGFEAASVTVATAGAWARAAPDVNWVPTEGLVERLRAVKDAREIDVLRRAAGLLSGVARSLREIVRAGHAEREVARSIDQALDRAGFERPAFDTIVASGPHSAHPHATPGERRLASGDLVVLDFGGVLDGYCVDLTRMAAIGVVEARAAGLVDAVRAAQDAAIAAVSPGVAAADVDRAAREALELRGLAGAFLHGTGHGLGLEVHEAPRLGPNADRAEILQAGMVCTIEPGAYLEGLGGARIEDDVLVTTSGRELLTDAPRDLLVV